MANAEENYSNGANLNESNLWTGLNIKAVQIARARTDATKANDVAQASLLKMCDAIDRGIITPYFDAATQTYMLYMQGKRSCSIDSYLTSIIKNHIRDNIRGERKRVRLIVLDSNDMLDYGQQSNQECATLMSNDLTPDEKFFNDIEKNQQFQLLRNLLLEIKNLSPQENKVITTYIGLVLSKILADNKEDSFHINQEVAKQVGIKAEHVGNVLKRARKKLLFWLKQKKERNDELPDICNLILDNRKITYEPKQQKKSNKKNKS